MVEASAGRTAAAAMPAEATFGARSGALWYIKHIYVWLLLLPHVNCAKWNGCVGSNPLPGTWDCYKILHSVVGYDAWKACKPLHIDLIQRVLGPKNHSIHHAEYPFGRFLWMGAIQEYPGSKTYLRYNQISKNLDLEEDPEDNASEECLALDITSLEDMRFVRRNCSEKLPIICNVQSKYIAHAYKASKPEACNNSNALSLLPLTGCFVINKECYNYSVIVREQWIIFDNLTTIESSLPVVILKMNTERGEFVNENDTLINSTTLCYIGHGSSKSINLRLKRSSGALRLWVGNPGRAEWPPECVGGEVHDSRGADPRALLVTPHPPTSPARARPIWCFTKDIITGDIVVSNRITIPGNINDEISNTCPDTTSPTGPPPGTTINHNASCLNCFREALHPCVRDFTNCKLCTEEHCGPFGINISQWRLVHTEDGNFEDFRKCAERAACVGRVLWELSEGGDCDGDGAFDCDDRLLRLLSPACDLAARDPRSAPPYHNYWACRTKPLRDFVDLPKDNKIARYFCENYTNKRRWIGPEYIPPESSFYLAKEVEKTIEELRTLQFVTVKLPNEMLTMKETEKIISNFSRLFGVSENVLRNAQRAAEVSSLPELLESILIKAPLNVSFTTANLAVSKKEAIGFQLISDKPLVGLETFGENPRQVPISSRDSITTDKVEAAVILPKIRKETSVVVVTFAKGSDFTSCKGPATAKSQKENRTVAYRMSFDGSNLAHEPTLPSHAESVENEELKSEGNCSYHNDLVRGCINTHVVQVGLLDKNGSYVQLPQGETVDILLRTKIMPMLGQTKTCAYWKPQEGGWASDGCELIEGKEGVDICRCSHLTHFAQLVSDATIVLGPHEDRLNTMSMCACMMSLLGFAGIILAGILSRRWREKTENQVMLNLAVAMSLFMGLFLWASLAPNPRAPLAGRCPAPEKLSARCQAAGAALHYAVLSTFCWMLVAAVTHYLRFTTFTATNAVPHFVLKSSLVGWGAPAVPVAVLAAAQPATYAGRGRDFCYPTGAAFYGAVLAPVLLVMLTNLAVFAMVLRVLFPRCCVLRNDAPRLQRLGYNERRDLVRRMIICVAFTFLFGVTWYLGLLSFAVWPAYVFCAVMALHGPALLLFFVIGEESIRAKLCGKKKRFGKSEMESTSGFSGSTNSTNVLTMSTHRNTRGKTRIQVLPSTDTYVVNGKNDTTKRSDIPGV